MMMMMRGGMYSFVLVLSMRFGVIKQTKRITWICCTFSIVLFASSSSFNTHCPMNAMWIALLLHHIAHCKVLSLLSSSSSASSSAGSSSISSISDRQVEVYALLGHLKYPAGGYEFFFYFSRLVCAIFIWMQVSHVLFYFNTNKGIYLFLVFFVCEYFIKIFQMLNKKQQKQTNSIKIEKYL